MKQLSRQELQNDLAAANKHREQDRAEIDKLNGDVRRANNHAAEIEKNFADLKERLQRAETELADLRGYVRRVQEDDTVNDGFFAITGEDRTTQYLPKRLVQHAPQGVAGDSDLYSDLANFTRQQKKKHWTSY